MEQRILRNLMQTGLESSYDEVSVLSFEEWDRDQIAEDLVDDYKNAEYYVAEVDADGERIKYYIVCWEDDETERHAIIYNAEGVLTEMGELEIQDAEEL